MRNGFPTVPSWVRSLAVGQETWPRAYARFTGLWLLRWADTLRQVVAFGLITLGVMATRFGRARGVVHPAVILQIQRSGIRLLPMITFVAFALGFVVLGQLVALLTRVGAPDYVGMVMVTVVVRELGPLTTAFLVLLRVGTGTVIELGTIRALGEVEALEALGIDPVHYLVIPRVIGITVAVLALTVYFISGTLVSGYLFAFLQDVPLTPGNYFRQLAMAVGWEDFLLIGVKSILFGLVIAFMTCFQGLARPLVLAEVSVATTRALVASALACVFLDAAFIVVYLLM